MRVPRLSIVCLLFMAAAAALPAHASSWWDHEWPLRKKITVDTGDTGVPIKDEMGNPVMLVRLHEGNFPFAEIKSDAADIRFVAEDDKTLLPFHIERLDTLLYEALVWVQVPELKPGGQTSFWLYYGNHGPKATQASDAKATYDKDTRLVYHFAEQGPPRDSTEAGNHAENAGTSTQSALIGGGLLLGGAEPVTIPASPSLAWTEGGPITWSAWTKLTTPQPNAVIYSRRDGDNGLVIGNDNGVPYIEVTKGGQTQRSPAGEPVQPGVWRHLAAVAEGSQVTLYLDGEPYGVVNSPLPALNSPAQIGGAQEGAAAAFTGEIDELEIASVARPPGFLKLAAVGQGPANSEKLIHYGEDEIPQGWFSWMGSGEEGHFAIIVESLTFDGWVCIVLLMIMAAVSWYVMISKASYLNGIARGNARFMQEWQHVARDLTVLDGDDDHVRTLGGRVNRQGLREMRNSSVFRIYHTGVEEIRHRLSPGEEGYAGNRVLSARSIQAIRAALDSVFVREVQRLNNLVVLLTIAISGGPFVGLLGTVIGVMITFAAVAAAGDVNVNAIAPGIAAALLATVAGLAVAIPALFGYNYLLARIKDATSDMQVFIDEFVTKMAEFYCERVE